MKLPRIYKTSATGATQIIDMEIIGAVYTRTWGQLDGKMQDKATTAQGKNIGKANETTPEQQAIIEAEAVWTKKQKANYSTSQEAPTIVQLPMKVSVYQKHLKKIVFPCFISPKLNGVNCEYRKTGSNSLELLSRGGEQYPVPAHQVEEIHTIMRKLGVSRLNGEMYIHGEFLQDITGAVKKPKALSLRLEFHIFDLPTLAGDYERREAHMALEDDLEFVKFIPVAVAHSLDEIDDCFKGVIALGYEGLMIRLPSNLYEYNKRSLTVFKYKEALDAEFEVIGYRFDKNGHTVFDCIFGITSQAYSDSKIACTKSTDVRKLQDKHTFAVKLKGTNEERLAMSAEADTYIGKYLKVEYEMLSKDGKPQKPVGIIFRKVDENGEAVE